MWKNGMFRFITSYDFRNKTMSSSLIKYFKSFFNSLRFSGAWHLKVDRKEETNWHLIGFF